MALIKTLNIGNTNIQIYDDYIPKKSEDKRKNLIQLYDVVNDISKTIKKSESKKWFLTENQIKSMKNSEKYNFI